MGERVSSSQRMTPYRLAGDSGVTAFRSDAKAIAVKFVDGRQYTYASAGAHHIEQMKLLAQAGQGLCGYINKHVREKYASAD